MGARHTLVNGPAGNRDCWHAPFLVLVLFILLLSSGIAAAKEQAEDGIARYQALAAQEALHAGERDFDRRLAQAAIDAGKIDHAIFVLERLRARYPRDMTSRLDLLWLYLARGDINNARTLLKEIPLGKAPPPLKAVLMRLKTELSAHPVRMEPSFVAEVSLGYASNPSGASSEQVIVLPDERVLYTETPKPAPFIQYRVTGQRQDRANGLWSFGLGQRHYRDARYPESSRLNISYQRNLSADYAVRLRGELFRQYSQRTYMDATLFKGLVSDPCKVRLGLLIRLGHDDTGLQPSREVGAEMQGRCTLPTLSGWQQSLAVQAQVLQAFWGSEEIIERETTAGMLWQLEKSSWKVAAGVSVSMQQDRQPLYPQFFGGQHRNLKTILRNINVQYRLSAFDQIGVRVTKRAYRSKIKLYQSDSDDIAFYWRRIW